jgi:hypothetical protein
LTSSQALSIICSSPSLREITLTGPEVADDDLWKSSRVILANLRKLDLTGPLRPIFTLLHQIDLPRNMDDLLLELSDVTVDDVSGIIGPYLRDYLQRRRSPESGLGLELSYCHGYPKFVVGDTGRGGVPPSATEWTDNSVTIFFGDLKSDSLLDLATYVPPEAITHLRVHNVSISTAVLSAKFPYVREINFLKIPLDVLFSNLDQDKMFPHLQRLCIAFDRYNKCPSDGGLLKTFLDHLESFGNRLDRLELLESDHIDPRVKEEIRGMVRELIL